MAGVSETTYYKWLELSEKPNAKKEYKEFRESVEQAEAEAEVAAIARIRQAADGGDWKAAGWYLERKHGERWGRNDKIRQEITGSVTQSIDVTFDEMKNAVIDFLSEDDDEPIDSGTVTEEAESGETPLA
jgi:hypothetical protein